MSSDFTLELSIRPNCFPQLQPSYSGGQNQISQLQFLQISLGVCSVFKILCRMRLSVAITFARAPAVARATVLY